MEDWDKIKLQFNADYNTVAELKVIQDIMSTLLHRREMYAKDITPTEAEMFMASFDTLTQGLEVK